MDYASLLFGIVVLSVKSNVHSERSLRRPLFSSLIADPWPYPILLSCMTLPFFSTFFRIGRMGKALEDFSKQILDRLGQVSRNHFGVALVRIHCITLLLGRDR
jgi:hypothetical protein